MKSCFRLLAALFALTGLLLLQAEGLWAASACSAGMGTPAASEMAEVEVEACAMGALGQSHEEDRSDSDGPACPLGIAGTTSCSAGIALLPSSGAPALGIADGKFSAGSAEHAKDLLLAVSLLRPPQA